MQSRPEPGNRVDRAANSQIRRLWVTSSSPGGSSGTGWLTAMSGVMYLSEARNHFRHLDTAGQT